MKKTLMISVCSSVLLIALNVGAIEGNLVWQAAEIDVYDAEQSDTDGSQQAVNMVILGGDDPAAIVQTFEGDEVKMRQVDTTNSDQAINLIENKGGKFAGAYQSLEIDELTVEQDGTSGSRQAGNLYRSN